MTQDALGQDHAPRARRHQQSHARGDVTTLANPEVVEQIRVMVQGEGPVEHNTEVGEDIRKFGDEG